MGTPLSGFNLSIIQSNLVQPALVAVEGVQVGQEPGTSLPVSGGQPCAVWRSVRPAEPAELHTASSGFGLFVLSEDGAGHADADVDAGGMYYSKKTDMMRKARKKQASMEAMQCS